MGIEAQNKIVKFGSKRGHYWIVDIVASIETKMNTQMPQPPAHCTSRSKKKIQNPDS
jgi:hypothetical protein